MVKKLLALMVATCVVTSPYAAKKAPAAPHPAASTPEEIKKLFSDFKDEASLGITTCKVARYVAETAAETHTEPTSDADYVRCIEVHKDAGKKSLSTLLLLVQKPSLKAALRNYELAVFASLSGIEPVLAESEAAYQRRQEELVKKLRAAWDEVELES